MEFRENQASFPAEAAREEYEPDGPADTTREVPNIRQLYNNIGEVSLRSEETSSILNSVVPLLCGFLHRADQEVEAHVSDGADLTEKTQSCLVHTSSSSPDGLRSLLRESLTLGEVGVGQDGLQRTLSDFLKYSVNTTAPGFMDKLYASPLPPGIAAELVLSVLNTNLHVYQVSPVLTLVEKEVSRSLAGLFGFDGPRSGGISVQGGSASNLTSIAIARNTLFPQCKTKGHRALEGDLVMFTSSHGHYSIEKAAQALGFGSKSVISVPVDDEGQMIPTELERLVLEAKVDGRIPFYVNATAGSTVLGSFDPFEEISVVARRHRMWLHVDGAWGGGFVFSENPVLRQKLKGTELADSIATNPHKMLGVPVTCSFLLGRDMQQFQEANTLKAGYLFHQDDGDSDEWREPYDLADMTLQCGRRGDSLKFFLCWQYYGTRGYATTVDRAYEVATYFSSIVEQHLDLTPVLARGKRPSCLQVCFYFTPGGKFVHGSEKPSDRALDGHLPVRSSSHGSSSGSSTASTATATAQNKSLLGKLNTSITSRITKSLIPRGFMIDFAPALEGQEDKGNFFRVVVNLSTRRETVNRLISELIRVGNALEEVKGSGP